MGKEEEEINRNTRRERRGRGCEEGEMRGEEEKHIRRGKGGAGGKKRGILGEGKELGERGKEY